MRLDDDQIAGKFVGDPVAKLQGSRHIVIHPGAQHRRVELLAPPGQRRRALGGGQIFRRTADSLGRLEQHPEQPRVHIGEAGIRVRVRSGENALCARFVRQVAFDEIVDAAQRRSALRADRIAQVIALHGSMIPERGEPASPGGSFTGSADPAA